MNERAASIVGLLFAVTVVVLVMNKHVFEEIIYDIRGVARPAPLNDTSYRRQLSSELAEERIFEAEQASRRDEARYLAHRQIAGPAVGEAAARSDWGATAATLDERGEIVAGAPEAADAGRPPDGGPLGVLPRLPADRASAIAVLRCGPEDAGATLWIAGLAPTAVPLDVDQTLPDVLRARFGALPVRPRRLGVAWYGCSEEVLRQTYQVVSALCATGLGNLYVYDMTTGRQLPMCGI